MRTNFFAIIFSVIFFIVGLLTLPHYGINWDTINHLPRGQVYLHYFLTGKKDFSDLPKVFFEGQNLGKWYWQKPESLLIDTDIPGNKFNRISIYQLSGVNFEFFMDKDVGHPPLSDILSAAFNLALFQKLGLINDIDSYRVYGVFLAASLVGLIFLWVSKVYGNFAGFIAILSLSLYPLFWSEMHFNTEKDIPEAIYWGFLLFSVWKGVTGRNWKWFVSSGIFFGLALGTKFNVVFIPFVILPWLTVVFLRSDYIRSRLNLLKFLKGNLKLVIAALTAPFIGITIFIASWPFLWSDPIARIGKVIGFYKTIGLTQNIDQRFLGPFGTNTFALQWILYTTPLIILILSTIGILAAIKRIPKESDKVSLLFLLWLLVPIARVTWPGSNIYGGIRQIMEYIVPLAILAGLGGSMLCSWIMSHLPNKKAIIANRKFIAGFLTVVAFITIFIQLIQIHPNENVYFNPLIGGLKGAKDREFPFWGNSFGASYRQGVIWLNQNAQENSNLVLVYEHHPNIAATWLRPDITLQNRNRSGYLRLGEYAMTLTYQGSENRSYFDMYLNRLVNPVYEVNVDGVSILKIWKNDEAHLKNEFKAEEKYNDLKFNISEGGFNMDLGEIRRISRLEIEYDENNCESLKVGHVEISEDNTKWEALPGILPKAWRVSFMGEQPSNGKFIEPFVGQKIRFVKFVLSPANTCLKNIKSIKAYYFKEFL